MRAATRITDREVLSYLASGRPEDEILSDFPQLTREDIRAFLAFAAERECRVVSSRQADQSGRLLLDEDLAALLVARRWLTTSAKSLRVFGPKAPVHLAELLLADRLHRTYNVGT